MRAAADPPPPAFCRSAPVSHPHASHSGVPNSAARFQKRDKSSLRPAAPVCTSMGFQVWGKSKALDGRIFFFVGTPPSQTSGLEFPEGEGGDELEDPALGVCRDPGEDR